MYTNIKLGMKGMTSPEVYNGKVEMAVGTYLLTKNSKKKLKKQLILWVSH